MAADTLTIEFRVEPQFDGMRLDAYLVAKIPRLSRSRAREILTASLRSPPGRQLKPATIVRPGLCFSIERPAPDEPPLPEVRVVAEDGDLLVVDKPAGLAVHPTARHHRCTLTAWLRRRTDGRWDPAHRLDRETSGLLACGRGEAAAALKAQFAAGRVEKSYLALLEGAPREDRFEVRLPLGLGAGAVRVKMAVGIGKPALTEILVRERLRSEAGEPFALVEARPRTGRQHQIRAHLAAAGCPVVGDKLYGPDERCFIRFTEGRLTAEDERRLRLPRQALHAFRLSLTHPADGRVRSWEAPLPADIATFLGSLRREA